MKKKLVAAVSLVALAGFALPVFAQDTPTEPITSFDDIIELIDTVASWLFTIILALAVVMLLYAAFLWLTASGDEDKVSTARKVLIYALIGIAIAFIAKGLVALIQELVGA